MSRLSPARAALLAALIASAGALGACGKTGELQRPKPLFGHARATPTTSKEADDKQRAAQDPSRPVNTVDPRDQILDPSPSRAVPIQGQSPNPMGVAPPTALPNPYARPGR